MKSSELAKLKKKTVGGMTHSCATKEKERKKQKMLKRYIELLEEVQELGNKIIDNAINMDTEALEIESLSEAIEGTLYVLKGGF